MVIYLLTKTSLIQESCMFKCYLRVRGKSWVSRFLFIFALEKLSALASLINYCCICHCHSSSICLLWVDILDFVIYLNMSRNSSSVRSVSMVPIYSNEFIDYNLDLHVYHHEYLILWLIFDKFTTFYFFLRSGSTA